MSATTAKIDQLRDELKEWINIAINIDRDERERARTGQRYCGEILKLYKGRLDDLDAITSILKRHVYKAQDDIKDIGSEEEEQNEQDADA